MKIWALISGVMLASCLLPSCGHTHNDAPYRMVEGEAWGSTFHVRYASDSDLDDSVVAQIRHVDRSLSLQNTRSILSRFNVGEDDHVDSLVVHAVKISQRVADLSDGKFDPSSRKLIRLWRKYNLDPEHNDPPTEEQIQRALRYVGINGCKIIGSQLAKVHPQMQLDFAAIIRGVGVCQIGCMLNRHKVEDYMVQVGDEVWARGLNPSGQPWHVPVVSSDSVGAQYVSLTDCVLSSCSTGYPLVKNHGIWRATFVDPTTGSMSASTTARATVVGKEDIVFVDAVATAVMVMEADEALKMLNSLPDIEGKLIDRDGTVRVTHGWESLLQRRSFHNDND